MTLPDESVASTARAYHDDMSQERAKPRKVGPVVGHPGPWDDFVVWYAPSDFEPPHEPDRPEQLEEIKNSMRSNGWAGRPLLACRREEHPQLVAQTGSHRLAAALAIGLDAVPVLVVTPYDHVEPSCMVGLEMLRAYAEEDGPEFAAAVAQLWELDY